MIFTEAPLEGVFFVDGEPSVDERGSFTRTYCAYELYAHGLEIGVVQSGVSTNRRRGTLRGLHYQAPPFAEAKLVSCLAGAIHDVVVDLRPGSRTYARAFATRLEAGTGRAVYIPRGFAHGFQTLVDDTVVAYQMTAPYHPDSARGLRWNDPALDIAWPIPEPTLSARDRALPLLEEVAP
jgi:dTDP-4-dehydrorhamnose 3,5-epimerase